MKKSVIILSVLLLAASAHAGWTPAERISDQATSFGPRMVANGDTLHVVYWKWDTAISVQYVRSTDGGREWEVPIYLPDSSVSGSTDSPIIKAVADTVIAIWYQSFTNSSRINFGVRHSIDGGGSGTNPRTHCHLTIMNSKNTRFP